jgi:hypothetical protein
MRPVGHSFSMPYAGYTGSDIAMGPIETADFASEGVTLTPATAADFDARARAILADNASPVLDLKPCLAIVGNGNARTVVAYAVEWAMTQRNGTCEFSFTQLVFPDAVAGTGNGLALLEGREIKTGGERLVGLGFEVWPPEYANHFRDYGLRTIMRMGEIARLRIALDAVIFEDGTMLGSDQSRLAENFIESVHAKQSLYRGIVVELEASNVREDVFAPLREILARHPAPHADRMEGVLRHAAAEILGFHHRVALEVFRRTLRREPFSIRKLSGR